MQRAKTRIFDNEASAVAFDGSAASNTSFAPYWTRLVETALHRYRHLFWETGMVGQVLYLEAEAAGVRAISMGIGAVSSTIPCMN